MRISTILILVVCCSADLKTSQMVKGILDSWRNAGYDKNIRPNYGDDPVNISIHMDINDLGSIDEADMSYSIDIDLTQHWIDNRLVFNASGLKKPYIVLGAEYVNELWIPDTTIANEVESKLHKSANTQKNALIRVAPNGTVTYSTRLTITATCDMDLHHFPMDSQTCQLELVSYGYTTEDVVYRWRKNDTSDAIKNIKLPNFDILDGRLVIEDRPSATGVYSYAVFEVLLTRALSFYINQVYIPVILIVFISWLPFWLTREDTHARVGLGVTTVLTITTMVSETNDDMPKVSYMKALDVYLTFGFWMVFLSLIQYAIVCYFTDSAKERSEAKEKKEKESKPGMGWIKFRRDTSKIDWHCRWIFPAVTLLFNAVYWTSYLSLSTPRFNAIN